MFQLKDVGEISYVRVRHMKQADEECPASNLDCLKVFRIADELKPRVSYSILCAFRYNEIVRQYSIRYACFITLLSLGEMRFQPQTVKLQTRQESFP